MDSSSNLKVFLDMDGVLVDFDRGMREAHGGYEWTGPGQQPWNTWEWLGMTEEAWWEPATYFDFWAELPWTEDGREILSVVEEAVGQQNICLMTSPSLAPHSTGGKLQWVQDFLPRYSRQLAITPAKHLFAHSGALLIDDNDTNLERFVEHGGHVIPVPRPWNRYWWVLGIDQMGEWISEGLSRFTVPVSIS